MKELTMESSLNVQHLDLFESDQSELYERAFNVTDPAVGFDRVAVLKLHSDLVDHPS